MIKLYKPNKTNPYLNDEEATQADIDQWNLDRGGPRMWGCSNKGGDTVMHDYQNGKFTHTMVASALQEIGDEIDRDEELSERIFWDIKRMPTLAPSEILRVIKLHREGGQS
jgi:hypothetical protein